VIDAATHQAIKKASVSLNYLTGQTQGQNQANHATSTDGSGAFSFEALPEGRYALIATHQNYPPVPGRSRNVIEVKSGEHVTSVAIELTPGAVIAGHVVDEDGDPMPGCFVQVSSARHPEQQRNGGGVNAEGEYRIHGLAPGKYIVSARCGQVAFTPRPFSAGPDPPPALAYPLQFYPLVPDSKSAQAIDLAPGVEKPGVDFRMRPAPVTQVRGSIAEMQGQTGPIPNVQLIPINGPEWNSGAQFDTGKGTFEFDRVFPGSYYIAGSTNGDPATRLTGVERIEVKDRPVELTLPLSHGFDLAGSVAIEDNNSTNKIPLTQLQVHVQPDLPIPMVNMEQAQVKEDGTFVLKSVPKGRWKLVVFGPQMYLKSAWLGTTDITHTAFEVSAGAEALRIVMSTALGTITGSAPAGEMVYAASDDPTQGQRTTQVDQTGRFTLPQVPPGKYRVGVTDPGVPIPEEGGQEVTVKEGETATVEVKQS
jgi:hypothetical protein